MSFLTPIFLTIVKSNHQQVLNSTCSAPYRDPPSWELALDFCKTMPKSLAPLDLPMLPDEPLILSKLLVVDEDHERKRCLLCGNLMPSFAFTEESGDWLLFTIWWKYCVAAKTVMGNSLFNGCLTPCAR
ncbi:uncharacterized protein TM35_000261740 [Trypanosoma theileri]|uniref:Uncharacterized protein n=1 Tax=Trypanosoma theileri TaxID=67003 RepID=A0A1X0NPS2_9TRYP|nr:uncharacterized protein TM35_000261740 [Trypanosoma theileri]ORC86722.1 hypothetical protein TM35_000261740 [Trypanosoma theileri]